MKKTIRKSLALLLAVLMLVSVSPMSLATDPCETHTWDKDYSCKLISGKYMITGIAVCSVCGDTKFKTVEAVVDEDSLFPTCTEQGTLKLKASFEDDDLNDEGKTYYAHSETVPALGHDFTGDVNPLNDGTHNYKCSREGCTAVGIMKEVTVDEVTKTVPEENGTEECTTEIEENKATCTTKAKCDVCGKEYGPAPAHDFELVEAVEPTCTDGGNKAYYKCKAEACGKFFEVGEDGNPDLEKEITDKDSVNLPALGGEHVKSDLWEPAGIDGAPYNCLEDGLKVKRCTRCGCILESEPYPKAASHSIDPDQWTYVSDDGSAFTCAAGGKRYHECTVCGAKCNEEPFAGSQPHDWEIYDRVESTCGTPGHTAYQKCKRCGLEQGKQALDPVEHVWTPVEAKAPTCSETGNEAYYICNNCGTISRTANELNIINDEVDETGKVTKTALEQVTIPMDDHDFETYAEALPASCTIGGRVEVFRCKHCQQLAVVMEKAGEGTYEIAGTIYKNIAALEDANTEELGHKWFDDNQPDSVGYVAPQCNAEGSYIRFCLRCDKKESVVIPALDHVKDVPVKDAEGNPITVAASCDEAAYDLWTCRNCHEEFKVYSTAGALGHVWGDEKVPASEATCTKKATIGIKCERCGAFKEEEEVGDLLPHNFDTVVEPADCDHDGKSYKVCRNPECGFVTDETVIPGGHIDVEPKDGYCDRCGAYEDCDHICHKTDFFSRFIWFIMNVWNQFLGINQECKCGELHYVKSGSIVVPD